MATEDVTLKTALDMLLQNYSPDYHRLLSKALEIQRRPLDGSLVAYIEDFVCLNFIDWLQSLPSNLKTDKALIKCKTALTNALKIPQIQDKLTKDYCRRTIDIINELWASHKQDEINRRSGEEPPITDGQEALQEDTQSDVAPSEQEGSQQNTSTDNLDITVITKMKNVNKEINSQVKILQARCIDLDRQLERTRFDAESSLMEYKEQLQTAQDQNKTLLQDQDDLLAKVTTLEALKNELETKLAQQTNLKDTVLKILLQQQEILLTDDKFEKHHIAPFIHIYKQVLTL